jgi:pyrimidine-nucleoside phosphorylase
MHSKDIVMRSVKELLRHKRMGEAWNAEEIAAFVDGVVQGSVTSAQAAGFLTSACIHGLTDHEIVALTTAMAESGDRLLRGSLGRPAVDKHSTGGVGDKLSLLVAPLAIACGCTVPMISGRGLGHTGGTVDKLESIVGFTTQLPLTEMRRLATDHGGFLVGQTPQIAPADRTLYALRDATGTVESIGLITASILSKKFAEGLDGLVMDMKVGRGAFMTTLDQAKGLADSIRRVCIGAGLPCAIVFSRMDEPLGRSVGNRVEVIEALESLKGQCEPDVHEVSIALATCMVLLGGVEQTYDAAEAFVSDALEDDSGAEILKGMIERQGGDLDATIELAQRAESITVYADRDGVVPPLDAMDVALAVMNAGGGRLRETDTIDPEAGVVFVKRAGSMMLRGDVLAICTAHTASHRSQLATRMQELYNAEAAPSVKKEPLVLDIWID